jgi:hypothetical protein
MTIKGLPHLELDRSAFDEFMRARTGLVEGLGIEERFAMVLENYAEFEAELLQQSLYNMLFDDIEWTHMAGVIHVFNRRLNNLLSTCRLYLDQTPRALGRIYQNDPEPAAVFAQARRAEYDAVLGYRVIEAVRNYSQHHNLPVTRFSVNGGEFPGYERELNHHTVIPSLDLEKLRRDPDFKQAILDELNALGTRYVDVRMLVRKYIEALGRVHSRVFEAISADLDTWESLMTALSTEFRSKWGGDAPRLAVVVCREATGELSDESYVVEEISARRKVLSKRNRRVTSYSRQVVSNFAGVDLGRT